MINIVFFGSSPYSTIFLKQLLNSPEFNILVVITKPDRPQGRLQHITPNQVAQFAQNHQLKLLQPQKFDSEFTDLFKSLKPDLALVVAYGPPFFDQTLIDILKYKIINIHPSPLPKYRGATPGPWQIINGETTSAVTFFQIDSLPDHGPIITQIPLNISPNDTADSFYQKAFSLASQNLNSILKSYVQNPHLLTPQDHSQKTYFPKFTKKDGQIDWSQPADKIERFIRALIPWPTAWTYVTNQSKDLFKMKILSATLNQNQITPQQIQIEGKKVTNWSEVENYYTIKKS
ncbi:methionyl-tRNA formyltransferase [Candidatus Shapirobacteria bacterium RIFOXYD1_FULL_38_32]|uniref:methionyl-tRNA formyltransferase n=3 Tax=Candidatus Shapironibacteriota TaxID=1752721 RepID=A0A0G0K157_9BACT|nr:MAG: Methionyl-tRNA formyltransferase [Candidatus Shapirobacteria bacterium GW2011_GWE2_38_30]KKQ90118.1 MAG: Methionyl-tRNA formyltransferase [Candidatus Shapirobacteria bacterium GW2011_GWE1_38_92]OGL55642.1 MAG: methionyl-tRNA formyltransferase [Candidatus Shapirobacteria bacterium RIFOXYA1_FULL_39_17]OGL55998.1 MAG: methionyl-tRNA formyltransferase [Candidatus Shapirobacteria bacterium RIFOXYB1_FULL_38_38]OGL58229.1 MAG: methionyl-tRNA formyltransferase [Candidatus Shapirobacteria bacter